MSSRRETAFLLLATFLVFAGGLWAPFHLDDFALLSDSAVTSPSGWLDCWRLGQSRPLTWTSFWLNFQLGGDHPFGYHLFNLIVHLACVALLSPLANARGHRAALALFALHPIQTEAIVYVFARATLLMTLFGILSLREWFAGRPWRAAAWFVPALLAKEECVAFPLFLIAVSGIRYRAALATMLAAAGAAGLRVLYAAGLSPDSGAGAGSTFTALEYLSAQGLAILRYLRLLLFPWGLTPESPLTVPGALTAIAAWATVALGLYMLPRIPQWRWLAGALVLLAPSSSFFPADDLSADRRLYLPLTAIALWAASVISSRKPAVTMAALFAALSIWQTSLWTRPAALWSHASEIAPAKVRPRIHLARALPSAEAEAVLLAARAAYPDDPRVPAELGRVYLDRGRADAALEAFGRALALSPGDPSAIVNRGVALWKMGQIDAAKADFRRALALDRCHPQARANLARLGEAAGGDCR